MFIAVVAIVAVAVLASAVGVFPPGGVPTVRGQSSVSVSSVDGLRLTLKIGTQADSLGGSVVINASEVNANSFPLNESAASRWAVGGLRLGACYSSVYPFGVAVYRGHYTQQNISSAVPLNLYPAVPCPLLIRYISGYYFQPSSDAALILPGSGPGVPMASGVVAAGNYTSGNTLSRFTQGPYTVAAGDEWGALAILYFTLA